MTLTALSVRHSLKILSILSWHVILLDLCGLAQILAYICLPCQAYPWHTDWFCGLFIQSRAQCNDSPFFFFSKFSTFLWCIWKARNNWIFQSSISYPWQVLFEAFYLSTSIAKFFLPTQSLIPSIFYTTQPASQSSFFLIQGP